MGGQNKARHEIKSEKEGRVGETLTVTEEARCEVTIHRLIIKYKLIRMI